MKPLLLRPHHGMCLQFFTGKGYSGGFVKNMKKICAKLERDPSQTVVLCKGPDAICRACPHWVETGCRSDPKPTQYDTMCLSACGFREGEKISWEEFSGGIRETALKSSDSFARICSDCVWFSVCQQLYVENLSKELKTMGIVQSGIFYGKNK